jgi:tetratricopeptide (TPR) repeat protein
MEAALVTAIRCSVSMQLYENAIFLGEQLVALSSSEENACILGEAYNARGQYHATVAVLKDASSPEGCYILARAYEALEMYVEAENVLSSRMMKETPFTGAAFYLRGIIARKCQRFHLAIEYFIQSLEINPWLWTAYAQLTELGADIEPESFFGACSSEDVRLMSQQLDGGVKRSMTTPMSMPMMHETMEGEQDSMEDRDREKRVSTPAGLSGTTPQPGGRSVTPQGMTTPQRGLEPATPHHFQSQPPPPHQHAHANSHSKSQSQQRTPARSMVSMTPPWTATHVSMSSPPCGVEGGGSGSGRDMHMHHPSSPAVLAAWRQVGSATPQHSPLLQQWRHHGASPASVVTPSHVAHEPPPPPRKSRRATGSHYPPHPHPPPGQRQLHLHDDGPLMRSMVGSWQPSLTSPTPSPHPPASASSSSSASASQSRHPLPAPPPYQAYGHVLQVPHPSTVNVANAANAANAAAQAPREGSLEGVHASSRELPPRVPPTTTPPTTAIPLLTLLGRVQLALCQYRLSVAETALQACRQLFGSSAFVLASQALICYEDNQHGAACQIWQQLRRQYPTYLPTLECYSSALWHGKKTLECAELAQSLLRLYPQHATTYLVIANAMSLRKDRVAAIKCCERALMLNSGCVYALLLKGHEESAGEDLSAALKSYRAAIRLQPRSYMAWYGIGSVYFRQEKLAIALKHFHIALSLHPASSVLHTLTASVLAAGKKPDQALVHLNKALELNGQNRLARFKKASVLMALNRFMEALDLLAALKAEIPRESAVIFLLGKCYKRLGQPAEALLQFQAALDLDPPDAQVIKHAMEKLPALPQPIFSAADD